jgi:hypothetical protein
MILKTDGWRFELASAASEKSSSWYYYKPTTLSSPFILSLVSQQVGI